MVMPEFTGRSLEFVSKDYDAAALILERLSHRIEPGLYPLNLIVDFLTTRARALFGGIRFGVELLIFGDLLDLSLRFAGVFANALEVSSVALEEFALRSAPGALAKSFVVQGPAR